MSETKICQRGIWQCNRLMIAIGMAVCIFNILLQILISIIIKRHDLVLDSNSMSWQFFNLSWLIVAIPIVSTSIGASYLMSFNFTRSIIMKSIMYFEIKFAFIYSVFTGFALFHFTNILGVKRLKSSLLDIYFVNNGLFKLVQLTVGILIMFLFLMAVMNLITIVFKRFGVWFGLLGISGFITVIVLAILYIINLDLIIKQRGIYEFGSGFNMLTAILLILAVLVQSNNFVLAQKLEIRH